MKTKKAYIFWTHPAHKQRKLQIGVQYSPHIVRADDPSLTHWSVCFAVTKENQNNEGVIDLSMLIDNTETESFFKTLTPGTEFFLLEAFTEVAHGYILQQDTAQDSSSRTGDGFA